MSLILRQKNLTYRTVRSIHLSNRKKIAILGWYGAFNVGDEAILSGILVSLKSVMPNSDFVTFSLHPKLTARLHGVKAFAYYKLFQILPKIDALVVGGGTLLTDWQLALPLFLYLISAVGWAKILRKPVVLYAVGAEPFSTRLGRFLVRIILNRVDLITVRGHRSKRALEMLGLAKPIHVTADPALTLQPADDGEAEEMLKREEIGIGEGPRVVVSLRRLRGNGQSVKFEWLVAEICDFLVESYGAEVIFLPMSTSVYDDDRKIMAETIGMMKNREKARLIIGRLTPQEAMAIIRLSSLLVSMRLHPLIFAAETHTPMIALIGRVNHFVPPSNNKISEFLEMINQESLIYNYEDASTIDLLSKIEELIAVSHLGNGLSLDVETLEEACFYNARLVGESVNYLWEGGVKFWPWRK